MMRKKVWFTRDGASKVGVDWVIIECHQLREVRGGYILRLFEDEGEEEFFLLHSDIERTVVLVRKAYPVA